MTQRSLVIVEVVLIEFVVFLFCYLVLVFLPERNHGIESFPFLITLSFLACLSVLFALFLIFRNLHLYRVTDIVGIFLDEISYFIFLQEF